MALLALLPQNCSWELEGACGGVHTGESAVLIQGQFCHQADFGGVGRRSRLSQLAEVAPLAFLGARLQVLLSILRRPESSPTTEHQPARSSGLLGRRKPSLGLSRGRCPRQWHVLSNSCPQVAMSLCPSCSYRESWGQRLPLSDKLRFVHLSHRSSRSRCLLLLSRGLGTIGANAYRCAARRRGSGHVAQVKTTPG